jgi:hypothetical protein
MELNLSNIQIDCNQLTTEEFQEIRKGMSNWNHNAAMQITPSENFYTKFKSDDQFYVRCFDESKTVVTYDEFLKIKKLCVKSIK